MHEVDVRDEESLKGVSPLRSRRMLFGTCVYVYTSPPCSVSKTIRQPSRAIDRPFFAGRYERSPHDDPFGHLTNSSINKRSPFASHEKDVIGGGCKWTLRRLRRWYNTRRTACTFRSRLLSFLCPRRMSDIIQLCCKNFFRPEFCAPGILKTILTVRSLR